MPEIETNYSSVGLYATTAGLATLGTSLLIGRALGHGFAASARYGLPISFSASVLSGLALLREKPGAPVKWTVVNEGLLECLKPGEELEQCLLDSYIAGMVSQANRTAGEERLLYLDGSVARCLRIFGRQLINEEIDALHEDVPALNRWSSAGHEKILVSLLAGPGDFVPGFEGKVQLKEAHFVLGEIDLRDKTITVHDTLRIEGLAENIAEEIAAVLPLKMKQECEQRSLANDDREWTIVESSETPRQKNLIDCGVFVAAMADAIAHDQPISQYTQRNIGFYREEMAKHIYAIPYEGDVQIALTLTELYAAAQDISRIRSRGTS